MRYRYREITASGEGIVAVLIDVRGRLIFWPKGVYFFENRNPLELLEGASFEGFSQEHLHPQVRAAHGAISAGPIQVSPDIEEGAEPLGYWAKSILGLGKR